MSLHPLSCPLLLSFDVFSYFPAKISDPSPDEKQYNDEHESKPADTNTNLQKITEKREQNMNIPNDFFQNLSISTCTKIVSLLTETISHNMKAGNIRGNDC